MLTPGQEKILKDQAEFARSAFIRSQLTDDDKWVQSHMSRLKGELILANVGIKHQQTVCSHPLIARTTQNRSNTGNYDNDNSYWTEHKCDICGLYWTTGQRWEHVGGKHGHPDDAEARRDD